VPQQISLAQLGVLGAGMPRTCLVGVEPDMAQCKQLLGGGTDEAETRLGELAPMMKLMLVRGHVAKGAAEPNASCRTHCCWESHIPNTWHRAWKLLAQAADNSKLWFEYELSPMTSCVECLVLSWWHYFGRFWKL
jgi:hypothetical protein